MMADGGILVLHSLDSIGSLHLLYEVPLFLL